MQYNGIRLPEGLREDTYSFIRNILNRLKEDKNLFRHDELALYKLAGNIDEYFNCKDDLKKAGLVSKSDRGNLSLHPLATYTLKLESLINNDLREMGLTLGSRTRLKTEETEDGENPFFGFAPPEDD